MSEETHDASEGADAHEVHHFESAGITEGNAKVPRWFIGVMLALFTFFVVYVVTYLTGVQPSSAQLK
jgi:hypothetical protein